MSRSRRVVTGPPGLVGSETRRRHREGDVSVDRRDIVVETVEGWRAPRTP